MFQKLVSHNNDIERLVEIGYAVAFDSNHLIVRDIPYLDNEAKLQIGVIVTPLVFVDQEHITQVDHQIFFSGSLPHNSDKQPIKNLGGGSVIIPLSENITDFVIQRSFSNKPVATGKFDNFFDKIESYVSIISGPAMQLYEISPYTFRAVKEIRQDSIFKFQDTLTSKAGITDLASKFKDDVIAIVGLGGTGSYILDYIVKTPVKEIRAFDLDTFCVHNSYRSPGKVESNEFGKFKTEVYHSRYDNFRENLFVIKKYVDDSSSIDLDGVTFAFICVDKGSSRDKVFNLLVSKGIPFIDVGMGLRRHNDLLKGMIRTTYCAVENAEIIHGKKIVPTYDSPDDIYKSNIQISELNALNASFAVIKFKQLRGFYLEDNPNYNVLFNISDLSTANESEIN